MHSVQHTGTNTQCQASNITASIQSDHHPHGYMLPVFFATDKSHRTPRSAEIQPMSQQAAAATRPYHGLVFDTRAPPVACPRRGDMAVQITGSTKQQ